MKQRHQRGTADPVPRRQRRRRIGHRHRAGAEGVGDSYDVQDRKVCVSAMVDLCVGYGRKTRAIRRQFVSHGGTYSTLQYARSSEPSEIGHWRR